MRKLIAGSGLTLFRDIKEKIDLKLTGTKIFGCGAVAFTYST